MPKQLNARIARLSLYMTCFVALFHCGSPEDVLAVSARDLQLSSQLAEVIGQLAVFAMSFFMAVSMYRLFSGLTLQTYGRKISRRVRSVLIPFVLWQLLFLALFKLQGADWSFRECLIRVFGFHMWPPDGPLWYLYSLFLLALLSPLLLIMRHRRLSLAGILLAICGLYSFRAEISAAIEGVFPGTYVGYTLTYSPAILLGAYLGRFGQEDSTGTLLSDCLFLLLGLFLGEPLFPGIFAHYAMYLLPVILLFVFPLRPRPYLEKLYPLCFLVYALHQPILVLLLHRVRPVMDGLMPCLFVDNLVTRVLFLLIDFAAAAAVCRALKRLCPRALALLTGGRV